ncbi:MAG: hypothetical protein A2234_03770 [Elusimicrobia bacterium RIFOXYA2_FULL_58_8]|nr:MAG: hypothetical protein A2234_03770 [Elusimicrobia bacterium RIFOXYA2_FULL_58_8]
MAGIGFELSKILKGSRLSSLLRAYGYSMVIASGPWLISIVSVLLTGYIAKPFIKDSAQITQFQVSITYLIAFSLIFTGHLQLYYTRYIADRIYETDYSRILPNTLGVILFVMGLFAVLLYPVFIYSFRNVSAMFALFFILTLGIMGSIWILNTLLTGIKNYKYVTFSFLFAYLVTIVCTYYLAKYGLKGLMAAYFTGQTLLFFMLLAAIIRAFPSTRLVEFDFLRMNRLYPIIMATGIIYNLAIWVDKFIFWYHPETGDNVIGPLRNSIIYDLPIFLSYLAIAPGMSVMFLRLETDFVDAYDGYFTAVNSGENLRRIYNRNSELALAARLLLTEVLRLQTIVTIVLLMLSEKIFDFFQFPKIYLPLFYIDLIGTQMQLLFISILSILFYLNRQMETLALTSLLLILNIALSYLSIQLGPFFHGYGFTLSFFIVSVSGILFLNRVMRRINYETFMFS